MIVLTGILRTLIARLRSLAPRTSDTNSRARQQHLRAHRPLSVRYRAYAPLIC